MTANALGPYRLSRAVTPVRYELTFEPDLEAATFSGDETIEVEVRERVGAIVLNAAELEIDEAWLESAGGARTQVSGVTLDEATERATLALASPAAPGAYTLHVSFRGVLNDRLRGFYRSTFTDSSGQQHTIATTQFESTDARRAFPCFDEPDFKAVFGVTLVVPEGSFAVSNGPVAEESVAGGKRTVRFADTMVMSTYLVAFIVGPFEATEPVDVNGTALRIVHPIGQAHLTDFALESGAFSLRFFEEYYGIPYPAEKLDLVAVPDFAFGAMENLGCVTFREALLLLDPERSTQAELMRVADVVAHEIAHMWFGDLVTMSWWNGIWLNEAFATFMAIVAVDAFRPEWERWTQFSLERSMALDVDALQNTRPIEYPVASPQDAEGMFDLLTYEKGGSVLRMLEQYLGEERFRDGIRHYLRTHSYGNAETTDLWDAIEHVTGEPVRRIMDSWIFQGGYPVLAVERRDDGQTIRLRQQRFAYTESADDSDRRWSIPIALRAVSDATAMEQRVLLEGDHADVRFEEPVRAVVVNAGGAGFCRVRYSADLLRELDPGVDGGLSAIERYGLVDDTWTSVLAGHTSAAEFMELARRFHDETDPEVWGLLHGCLAQLDRIVDGEARERLRAGVRALFGPALDRLGWEPRPDESGRVRELRSLLIRGVSILGNDPDALRGARQLHARYLEDPGAIDADVAAAVTGAVASNGMSDDYETFVQRFKSPANPQEEQRYLRSLAAFPGAEEMGRTLAMTLSGDARTQDAPFLLAGCLANREHGWRTWEFIVEHWDEMNAAYPSNSIVRMLSGIRALSRSEQADAIEAFFAEHEVPQGRLMLAQHLEKLRVNVALRERESERLGAALG